MTLLSNQDSYSIDDTYGDRAGAPSWVRTGVSAAIVGLGATGLAWALLGTPKPGMGTNLCATGAVPAHHAVVWVDQSDPLNPDQHGALESSLRTHFRTLAQGDRLTIYRMTPEAKTSSKIVFDRCKPKPGDQADPKTEHPARVAAIYEQKFHAPFEEALVELAQSLPSAQSPILEALHAMAASEPMTQPAGERTIELWSDMLAHSKALDQFKPGYRFEDLSRARSAWLEVPAFASASVTVYELSNDNQRLHTAEHARFWAQYFAHVNVATGAAKVQRL